MFGVYISPSAQENNYGVANYGTEEYEMNLIADFTVAALRRSPLFKIARNNPTWSLSKIVEDSNYFYQLCINEGIPKDKIVHFANHTNAGGGKGSEVYGYAPGTNSDRLAQCVYKYVAPLTPSPDRGVKYNPAFMEIGQTKATAALIEIIFHDFVDDAVWLMSHREEVGEAIAHGIYDFFSVAWIPKPAPQPTPTPQPSIPTEMYRVRKTWADVNSQIGAYKELDGAKQKANENPGYTVFDSKGNALYTYVPPVVIVNPPTTQEPPVIIEEPKPDAPPVVVDPIPDVPPVVNPETQPVPDEVEKTVGRMIIELFKLVLTYLGILKK